MGNDEKPGDVGSLVFRWFYAYMPASVLMLGVLFLGLLVWTDRVSDRQLAQSDYAHVLQDLRIRTSTAHLWLEEAITYSSDEIAMAWADLDRALRLADALLTGGEAEHGIRIPPLTDPALHRQLTDLKQELLSFEANAHERWRTLAKVGSPLDKRTNEIFQTIQARGTELEKVLLDRQLQDRANARRVFIGILIAWSLIVAGSTTELVRREKKRQRAEAALQTAKGELESRVAERTKALGDLNQALQLELAEREKTEAALRASEAQSHTLSTRLLAAQETERRRISTELHDELGHALAYLKLQLGLLQRGLRADQPTSKEECARLAQFVDQTIENVRRLARDLSPAILENLGLSAALHWLVDTCVGNHETQVVSAVANVDQRFTSTDQILVYRIVQEALTNVQKHAGATHVRLAIEAQADRLAFVVEDDGKGFNAEQTGPRMPAAARDRGLGLTTMEERAQMLRGTLRVWSAEGQGTRVPLMVPAQQWRDQ
ncbi:MAG TPA: sensor histidine kinase [Candidatus Acidoferrum sp.]|nr:sensor histidine kinase [Candidatus Acidoferrum sp.]